MDKDIGDTRCTQCSNRMIMDFDTKSETLYGTCMRCGFTVEVIPIKDEHGHIVRGIDGIPETEVKLYKGYGVLGLAVQGGLLRCYALTDPYKDDSAEKLRHMLETAEDIDRERSYVALWDEKNKQLYCIYGKTPDYVEG